MVKRCVAKNKLKLKTKVVYRETQNGGHYECYDFETQRVIDEIERQLNELKDGK